LAFFVGLGSAFLLNRRFVFRGSTNRLGTQIFWFVAVNVVALAQTLLVSLLFADFILPWLGIHRFAHECAHAIGIVAPIATSFLGHKHFSFRTAQTP
ncbi:MAG TPA: GtrA family protein, partial [Rudaea sp.]